MYTLPVGISSSKALCMGLSFVYTGLSMEHHHELLVSALKKPIQGHWMELGTHLDLSENFLDETETNIEKEEDCLEEILQNWLKYQESSMEALGKALTKMNLSTLTFDPSSEGQSHTATHR